MYFCLRKLHGIVSLLCCLFSQNPMILKLEPHYLTMKCLTFYLPNVTYPMSLPFSLIWHVFSPTCWMENQSIDLWVPRRFNRLRCWITTWCLGDLQIHGEGQINGRYCVQGSVMKEHRSRSFPHHKHGLQLMRIQCWWLEMCFLSWITSDWEFQEFHTSFTGHAKRMDDWITSSKCVCVGWCWRLSLK